MKIKSVVIVSGLMAVACATHAQMAVIQDTTEYAHVLNYSPMPGPQVPRQVCTPVTVTQERVISGGSSVGGAIVGGVLGAVVGSRFGGGHGRDAATVAGAIGGTMIGGNMNSDSGPVTTTQTQCHTLYEAGPPSGYQVTYDYKGKLYTTILRSPPGEYLRVRNRITVE